MDLNQSWSTQAPPIDIPPHQQPMVRIETTGVHNQCRVGVSSVMLNNQSVTRFRITYMRRHVNDEYKTAVLDPQKWLWIGCADDGYTYALYSLTKL